MGESDRIKKYSRIKYTLAIVDILFTLLVLAVFQTSGLAVDLRESVEGLFTNPLLVIFIYSLILFLLYSLLGLPLDYYRSYSIEHRFGLSQEKFPHWLTDQLKELLVGFVIFIILVESFFYCLRYYPDNWWWIAGLFWIFFSVILAKLFPNLIIPLFFKYKRIKDEELRQRILNLANKMAIKILDVYQIDFSKKTTKANAALVGLGKSKRVILTDTLQGKFTPDEIEVILAHEFAHYRLRHIIKTLVLNAITIMLVFYLFFRYAGLVFDRFNLNPADIAGLSIWLFCFMLLQLVLTPFLNTLSRIMESNADKLALGVTKNIDAFISMMEKLSLQNLSERDPAKWIKILFFDHPPVVERVKLAEGLRYAGSKM